MTSGHNDESSPWARLGPVEQARDWEDFRPGTFEQMFAFVNDDRQYKRAIAEQDARHERRLDYIAVMLQLSTLIFGLAAVGIISFTAIKFLQDNAASEGARIFGFGTGSIVAAFLGVKATPILKRVNSRWKRIKSG